MGSSELAKLHLEHSIQFWSLQFITCVEKLERAQGKVTTVLRGLENMSCEEQLGELGLFSRIRRTPMENTKAACKYAKGN